MKRIVKRIVRHLVTLIITTIVNMYFLMYVCNSLQLDFKEPIFTMYFYNVFLQLLYKKTEYARNEKNTENHSGIVA